MSEAQCLGAQRGQRWVRGEQPLHQGLRLVAHERAPVVSQGSKLAWRDIELIYRNPGGPNPGQTKTLVQELIVKDKVDYLSGFVLTPNAFAVASNRKSPR